MIYWSLGQRIETDLPLRLPYFSTPVTATLSVMAAENAQGVLHDTWSTSVVALQDAAQDARITLYETHEGVRGLAFEQHGNMLRLCYRTETPSQIVYAANASFTAADLASVVEGPLLGWWLREQGHALLHASSISWQGRQLAITATPGVGKSTLAALLCHHGATLWSDDILVFDPTTAMAWCDGRPQRLSQAASQLRDRHPEAGQPIHSQTDKIFATKVRDLDDTLTRSRSIDHVLVLVDRTTDTVPTFQPMAPAAAIAALLHGRYPTWLRTPEHQRRAFEAASQLAQHVPVTLGRMPHGIPSLQQAGPALMEWLAQALHN